MHRTLITLTIAAAALQSPVLRGQAPPAPPTVTFQVEVNYVDVDVVVTDEKGTSSGDSRETTSRCSRTASRRKSTPSPT